MCIEKTAGISAVKASLEIGSPYHWKFNAGFPSSWSSAHARFTIYLDFRYLTLRWNPICCFLSNVSFRESTLPAVARSDADATATPNLAPYSRCPQENQRQFGAQLSGNIAPFLSIPEREIQMDSMIGWVSSIAEKEEPPVLIVLASELAQDDVFSRYGMVDSAGCIYSNWHI